jgi:hypothetical protein
MLSLNVFHPLFIDIQGLQDINPWTLRDLPADMKTVS